MLNIEKPVPPSLEVINVEDRDPTLVGHVNTTFHSVHDMLITFGNHA